MKAKDFGLNDLLTVDRSNGTVHLMGHRALIFDAVALGLLRKELIDSLGAYAARAILTRFGYAHGWRVAEVLRSQFPAIFSDAQAGACTHEISGITHIVDFKSTDGDGDAPLIEATWSNSYEVEQHLLHFGKASEATCWTLTGFASGYESCKNGREVVFIEHKCVAKGDSVCQIQGKFREKWDKRHAEQLEFYDLLSADEILRGLVKKLRKTENQISRRRLQLGLLDKPSDEQFGFVVRSKAMQQVVDLAQRVAKVDMPIVVMGESGVGKERIARLIHDQSIRTAKAFVAVNCGALAETLLESELFGHVRGAFTGADRDREGLFEAAKGGTIFLDEIGEISANMQVKLLRVLQEKEVRRIGENKVRSVDVRVIAATNRNLDHEVAAERFRKDLYYRLCAIEVVVPPLRERSEDILLLARLFLKQSIDAFGSSVDGFTPQVAERLLSYDWPGNVRELSNAIARSVALCNNRLVDIDDLPKSLRNSSKTRHSADKRPTLEEMEREYILDILKSANNKRLAARQLGISPSSLYRKLNEYGYHD